MSGQSRHPGPLGLRWDPVLQKRREKKWRDAVDWAEASDDLTLNDHWPNEERLIKKVEGEQKRDERRKERRGLGRRKKAHVPKSLSARQWTHCAISI
jgi:hypothetical protein